MERMMGFDTQMLIQMAIQFINTAVLCFALGKILYNPVKNFLRARNERIGENINDVEQLLSNAEMLKEWYDEKMKAADYDSAEIIEAAKKRANNIENQIIAEAKEEASAIKARAMQEIEMEKENSLAEMKKQIIDISAMIAERYVQEKMDAQTSTKLLDEAIEDLGDATWLN